MLSIMELCPKESRFLRLLAEQDAFGPWKDLKYDIDTLEQHFDTIAKTFDQISYCGKICDGQRIRLIRALLHGDLFGIPMFAHVRSSVENFADIAALRDYSPVRCLERAYARDTALVLLHVLAECLASHSSGGRHAHLEVIADLADELLAGGRQAKLCRAFEACVGCSSAYVLKEATYATLFYLLALQTSERQWQVYTKRYTQLEPNVDALVLRRLVEEEEEEERVEQEAGTPRPCTQANLELAEAIFKTAPLSPRVCYLVAVYHNRCSKPARPRDGGERRDDASGKGRRLAFGVNLTGSQSGWYFWLLTFLEKDVLSLLKAMIASPPQPEEWIVYLLQKVSHKAQIEYPGLEMLIDGSLHASQQDGAAEAASAASGNQNGADLFSLEKQVQMAMVAEHLRQKSFKEAAEVVMELIEDVKTMADNNAIDGDDNGALAQLKEHLNLVYGYAAARSLDRDLMRRARQLLRAAKVHRPMAMLWLAELEMVAYAFEAARSSLEEASFEIVMIPGINEVLEPTTENAFEAIKASISSKLDNPPQSDYSCCYREYCTKREIFEKALDFSGLVRVSCDEACTFVLHPECWKAHSLHMNLAGGKAKHGLGAPCCTPDCQGRVTLVTLFNSKMEAAKEYRWSGASRRFGPQDSEGGTTIQELNSRTAASRKAFCEEVIEALRCVIASSRHLLSVAEVTSLCESLSGYDNDFVSSLVETTLDRSELADSHPEWNRAEWLGAAMGFLEDLDPDCWSEVNSSLQTAMICEPISVEEILAINEEHSRLEKELQHLADVERELQSQAVKASEQLPNAGECVQLVNEVRDLEQEQQTLAERLVNADIKLFQRRLALKQKVLDDLDHRLAAANERRHEVTAELAAERSRHELIIRDRAELARTVRDNAAEAHLRLSRALMELVECRHDIVMDVLESVENAAAANLREAERARETRVYAANRIAKPAHFKLMNDVRQRAKAIEKETRTLMERLRNDILDHPLEAAPTNCDELLWDLVQRYSSLPPLYRKIQDVTIAEIAQASLS